MASRDMNKQIGFFLLFTALLTASCNRKPEKKVFGPIQPNIQARQEKTQPYVPVDQSPMDMSYFPVDYPILKMNGSDTTALVARVAYSRPQKKGRPIFGDSLPSLVHYGKEWRLGANEATEIEFFRPVNIQTITVPPGRYVMYCIPRQNEWTLILNTNLFTWGLHMEPEKDKYRFTVPVQKQEPSSDFFTMLFEPADHGARLIMAWDDVKAILPIRFDP